MIDYEKDRYDRPFARTTLLRYPVVVAGLSLLYTIRTGLQGPITTVCIATHLNASARPFSQTCYTKNYLFPATLVARPGYLRPLTP